MGLDPSTRPEDQPSVARVAALEARSTAEPWPLAMNAAGAIADHFRRRQTENPRFFDGEVLVLRSLVKRQATVLATFSRERFSSFLYWRDDPARDPAVRDGFVSAVVRSAEGHVLLGLTGAGTLNAHRLNVPGGFIDPRDIANDGSIDIDGAATRELAEETGLDVTALQREPGYLIAEVGPFVSFAVSWRSSLGALELQRRMRAGLAVDPDHELADIVVAASPLDLAGFNVVPHIRLLVAHLTG